MADGEMVVKVETMSHIYRRLFVLHILMLRGELSITHAQRNRTVRILYL